MRKAITMKLTALDAYRAAVTDLLARRGLRVLHGSATSADAMIDRSWREHLTPRQAADYLQGADVTGDPSLGAPYGEETSLP